jgi:hypothetical protein
MVSVKLLTLFSLDLLPQNQAYSSAVTPANVLELTNYSRQAYRLQPLHMNGQLSKAAQAKAEDMVKSQYFDHESPKGKTPWDFIKAENYNYLIAGENLAINYYNSEALENAWMNSPGHKANILNRDFEDIGIGVVQGTYNGVKAIFVVQMFGTRTEQQITPSFAFNKPQQKTVLPEIAVPNPINVSLATPILVGEEFNLTKEASYTVRGYAPEANDVYVVVNNKPQVKLEVIEGQYAGNIILSEGVNKVSVMSFNSRGEASPISKNINVKLDSVAPEVTASINPVSFGDQKEYVIEVQSENDAAKIIATVGGTNLMLQPGSKPNTWEGRVLGEASKLQGGINIRAYDLAGNIQTSVIGTIAPSLESSYGFYADKNYQVSVLGKAIPLKAVNNMYIYFIVFLLACLALAIGLKRNIQHLGLIAHTSAMIIVASVLWIT